MTVTGLVFIYNNIIITLALGKAQSSASTRESHMLVILGDSHQLLPFLVLSMFGGTCLLSICIDFRFFEHQLMIGRYWNRKYCTTLLDSNYI